MSIEISQTFGSIIKILLAVKKIRLGRIVVLSSSVKKKLLTARFFPRELHISPVIFKSHEASLFPPICTNSNSVGVKEKFLQKKSDN